MKRKNNGGFSLVEILVAMAILASVVIPVCTSMVLVVRVNGKSEAMLQAKIAVSSAVEKMMAQGIWDSVTKEEIVKDGDVEITITPVPDKPYYEVTAAYVDDQGRELVAVDTCIRAVPSEEEEGGES